MRKKLKKTVVASEGIFCITLARMVVRNLKSGNRVKKIIITITICAALLLLRI